MSKAVKTGFCSDCKRDKTLLMTATDVKINYGLTDEELNDKSNGFNIYYYKNYKTLSRKFIIEEIENYVKNTLVNGNVLLKKKLEKVNAKKLKKIRINEIDTFILSNIVNKNDSDLIKIINEYKKMINVPIDKICSELSKKDKELTQINNHKNIFISNLKHIALEKISDQNYFIQELGISSENVKKFMKSEEYNIFVNNIDYKLREQYLVKYHTCLSAINEIKKSDIFPLMITYLKTTMINKFDIFMRKNELTEKLNARGLTLRNDSKICQWYIDGSIDNVNSLSNIDIMSVNDIVDIMEALIM